jgi:hypothetical protein
VAGDHFVIMNVKLSAKHPAMKLALRFLLATSAFSGVPRDRNLVCAGLGFANSESFKVEIGFRATMVTVDRGGWFQPQFFKQSSGFYHIDKKIFASKWPEGINSMEDLRNAKPAQWEALNKGLFPAYPVGFIICKVCLQFNPHLSFSDDAYYRTLRLRSP